MSNRLSYSDRKGRSSSDNPYYMFYAPGPPLITSVNANARYHGDPDDDGSQHPKQEGRNTRLLRTGRRNEEEISYAVSGQRHLSVGGQRGGNLRTNEKNMINSPDSNDSGIQADASHKPTRSISYNESYNMVNKRRISKNPPSPSKEGRSGRVITPTKDRSSKAHTPSGERVMSQSSRLSTSSRDPFGTTSRFLTPTRDRSSVLGLPKERERRSRTPTSDRPTSLLITSPSKVSSSRVLTPTRQRHSTSQIGSKRDLLSKSEARLPEDYDIYAVMRRKKKKVPTATLR